MVQMQCTVEHERPCEQCRSHTNAHCTVNGEAADDESESGGTEGTSFIRSLMSDTCGRHSTM